MQAEEGVLDEFGGCPLACGFGVGGGDVAVYFADAEAYVIPICRVMLDDLSSGFSGGKGRAVTNGVDWRWWEI